MPVTHLLSSTATLAAGQAPVVVQIRSGGGLDLIAVAVGALATLGVLLALAGARLLLKRHTHVDQRGGEP